METTGTSTRSEQPQLKRHIGIVGLLFASVGSVIGAGWTLAGLSVLVHVVANKVCLRPEIARELIEQSKQEAAVEEEEIGTAP